MGEGSSYYNEQNSSKMDVDQIFVMVHTLIPFGAIIVRIDGFQWNGCIHSDIGGVSDFDGFYFCDHDEMQKEH